uniref:Transposase n=1 Tax=Candidatus Kentrum sp. LFY TaxID=2126342 RepID=A0A450WDE5_9GAMM|nr:MAG: Transposase [Candidatus Kentron sp. LFY]
MPHDRQIAIELVREAVETGASQNKACKVLELDERTLRRWKKQLRERGESKDRRKEAMGTRVLTNKLTEEGKARIIDTCNQVEYQSSPPSQVVPRLADEGIYIKRDFCTKCKIS